MKNQYVGDVGDYGKYSLLRAFSEAGIRVGINWYLTENDKTNDGKHVTYLNKKDMRKLDPVVYDVMKQLIDTDCRSVSEVQKSGLIKDALYYGELLKIEGNPPMKEHRRITWFLKSMDALKDADLIYMDPDNGLLENNDFLAKGADKYVFPDEVKKYYYEGHNVVYYCHKGRRTYTQWDDYKTTMFDRLPDVRPVILTFHKGTQRSYIFLIHEKDYDGYRKIIYDFLRRWHSCFSEEDIGLKAMLFSSKENRISFTKSDGTVITIEGRDDGQIQMTNSSRPGEQILQSVDLFSKLLGY